MVQQKVQISLINREQAALYLFQVNSQRGSFWQNITGSVEKSDANLAAAAIRELKEESGVTPLVLHQLPLTFTFHDQWDRDIEEFCFVATTNSEHIKLSTEHINYQLIPLDSVTPQHFKYSSNYDCFLQAKEWFYHEQ